MPNPYSSDKLPRSTGRPAVVLDGVSKTYRVSEAGSKDARSSRRTRGGRLVTSLKPLSLVARAGESIGVVGHNGSGKSTLLKLIAGAESPTTGRVLVSSTPMLLGVAPALQPYLTGRQNIVLGLLALGLSRDEAKTLEPEISRWADIGDAIDRPLRTYSAGQGARLSFAISTAVEPEILLVDEALSTGDAAFSARARERMERLLAGTGNLFLVSHSAEQITDNCSRALWIHRGEMLFDGDAKEVVGVYKEWSSLANTGKSDQLVEEVRNQRASLLNKTKDGSDE